MSELSGRHALVNRDAVVQVAHHDLPVRMRCSSPEPRCAPNIATVTRQRSRPVVVAEWPPLNGRIDYSFVRLSRRGMRCLMVLIDERHYHAILALILGWANNDCCRVGPGHRPEDRTR